MTRAVGNPQGRAGAATDILLAVALGTALLVLAVPMFWNRWPGDLSALWMAGHAVASGLPEAMYDAPADFFSTDMPARWRGWLAEMGHGGELALPYLYPPIWGYGMAPLTHWLSPMAFFNAVLVAQVAMLAAMPWLGWAIVRPNGLSRRTWLIAGFVLLLSGAPGLGALMQNQPQISVTFLVLLSALMATRERPVAAGLLMALAAALKLQPALFGLVFLLTGNWRAALAMTIAGLALAAASLGVAGVDLHHLMLERLGQISSMVVITKVNYAPEAVLYQLWQLASGLPVDDATGVALAKFDAPAFVELLPRLMLIGGLAGLIWRQRRASIGRLLLAISLLAALFGPLSWGHYFILPAMLLPALFEAASARIARVLLACWAILFSYPLFAALTPYNTQFLISALPPLLLLMTLGAIVVFRRG